MLLEELRDPKRLAHYLESEIRRKIAYVMADDLREGRGDVRE